MALCVMAVAAPENLRGTPGRYVLKSEDPVSLYNACRYAASLAADGIGSWGESNWAISRQERQRTVMLMHAFEDDLSNFETMLKQVRPNLLLIGAMSVSFPGAIACAQKAKEILGDEVCIVLGGRHASESIYLSQSGIITHHASSPLCLMANNRIAKVFDLVVSGEGECIIPWIGEVVDSLNRRRMPYSKIAEHIGNTSDVPGRWIVGWVSDVQICTTVSAGIPIDRNLLLSPSEAFGIRSSFDVFVGRLTAHVFSDMGCGCVFDCNFCSERRSVTGPPSQLGTSAIRLFRQLQCAVKVVAEDSPRYQASAFIEDSTILAGSTVALRQLTELLYEAKLDIRFGGQLTIDQINSRIEILRDLKSVGLDYLFIGIETFDPEAIGGMSKDVHSGKQPWSDRVERVINLLASLNIKCGSAILFGLGESHQNRLLLLQKLEKWLDRYGAPNPISINWAVQHPLRGDDGGTGYDYTNWSLPTDEWLEAFSDFGEASVLYPIAGQKPPVLSEVQELAELYRDLLGRSYSGTIAKKR